MDKPIALAADHGGFELKEHIRVCLEQKGMRTVDFGTNSAESVDYSDFAVKACDAVTSGECECALLFCGTGIGMSMAANRIKGIRAACCSDVFSAEMTRRHNDANALCLGARVVGFGLAEKLVSAFLQAPFEDGRHARRVQKLSELER